MTRPIGRKYWATSTTATQMRHVSQIAHTFACRTARAVISLCIAGFGRTTTVPSREAITFTTATAIQSTTPSAICNASLRPNIGTRIHQLKSSANGGADISRLSDHWPRFGTALKKAVSYIARMVAGCGSGLSRIVSNASNATVSSKCAGLAVMSSVRGHAYSSIATRLESMTSTRYVQNAAKGFDTTNIDRTDFAAEPVQCVRATGQLRRVFDLSVEGSPEYVVEGILVHNCIDALRYSLDGYIQKRGNLGVWMKLAKGLPGGRR
jgi:hypothetical protein